MNWMLAPALPGMTRAEAVVGFVEQLIKTRRLLPGDLIGTKSEIRESVHAPSRLTGGGNLEADALSAQVIARSGAACHTLTCDEALLVVRAHRS
jgi:hypothetical protein